MTDHCPICRRGKPNDVLAELSASWATGGRVAPLPGYLCVVAKTHVVEPFELPPPERAAFWEDCLAAAAVLQRLYRPAKLNYEIHGNTIPHLHLHLYPRFAGDPYEGGPINGGIRFRRSEAELARMREALDEAGGA